MVGCLLLAFTLCQAGYYAPAAPAYYPAPQQYYAPAPAVAYAPPVYAYPAYPAYSYGYPVGGYPVGVNLGFNFGGRGFNHGGFRR